MKKILLVMLLLSLSSVLSPAQEKTGGLLPQMPLEERMRQAELRDITAFSYAYLECRGPYTQISAKINEFMGLFFKQGLVPTGGFFAMYLNAPDQVHEEDLLWRLGFPVSADAAVIEPLRKDEFNYSKAVVYLYVGPYENIRYAYGKIAAFCDMNGYKAAGPSLEKYLDMNPQAVKPEDLRTEVLLPVEKK